MSLQDNHESQREFANFDLPNDFESCQALHQVVSVIDTICEHARYSERMTLTISVFLSVSHNLEPVCQAVQTHHTRAQTAAACCPKTSDHGEPSAIGTVAL